MNDDIRNDVHLVMQHVYNQDSEAHDQEPDEEEDVIHVHHFPDARLIELPDGTIIFKKSGSTTTNIPVVDSTPKATEIKPAPLFLAYLMVGTFLLLTLSSILFQLYVLFHPPIATITLIPKSAQMTLSGTLQLGRELNPITLSQSQTVPTTGKGHQDAKAATGTVTFYNGSNTPQTMNAGTVFTGNDGIQVATDADANIPAANPPVFGQATVSAHVTSTGAQGNIQAYDIHFALSSDLTVKNLAAFTGGLDARDFQVVTQQDIDSAATPLQATLSASMQGALQGELKNNEALLTNSCRPTVAPDHHAGEEATRVNVTVSETCSAVAYNRDALKAQGTQLLTTQAIKKLGTGYSLLGDVQVTVNSATVTGSYPTLAFSCSGVWVYAVNDAAQEHIKMLIAGKTKQEALHILQSLPGIEKASTQWDENTKLPKNIQYIHLVIIAGI